MQKDKTNIWIRLRYWQKGGIIGFLFGLFGFLLFGTTLKSNILIFYFQELFWWAWKLPYWNFMKHYCPDPQPCKLFIPFAPAFLYCGIGIVFGLIYGLIVKNIKVEVIKKQEK